MQQSAELDGICGQLDRGEIDDSAFLEALMRHVAAQFGCSRAGVWFFRDGPDGRLLHCVTMYDARMNRTEGAPDRVGVECSAYFEALLRDGSVVARDARMHPATQGFIDYLRRVDVYSSLDVCVSVNGVALGAFTCEQVGAPKAWTQRQLNVLRQIGARASLALMHAAKATVDTAPGALWESSTPNRLATMPAPLDPLPPKDD